MFCLGSRFVLLCLWFMLLKSPTAPTLLECLPKSSHPPPWRDRWRSKSKRNRNLLSYDARMTSIFQLIVVKVQSTSMRTSPFWPTYAFGSAPPKWTNQSSSTRKMPQPKKLPSWRNSCPSLRRFSPKINRNISWIRPFRMINSALCSSLIAATPWTVPPWKSPKTPSSSSYKASRQDQVSK